MDFRELFINENSLYGKQNEDGSSYRNSLKGPITESLLAKHFRGEITLATHDRDDSGLCKWGVIDLDILDKEMLRILIKICINHLGMEKNNILPVFTGNRGYHLFVFFEEPVRHSLASKLLGLIKTKAGEESDFDFRDVESYPNGSPHLVRLAGLHRKSGKWSEYLDLDLNPLDIEIKDTGKLKIKGLKESEVFRICGGEDPNEEENYERIPYTQYSLAAQKCNAMKNILRMISKEKVLGGHKGHRTRVALGQIGVNLPEGNRWIHELFRDLYDYDQATTEKQLDSLREYKPPTCATFSKLGWCDGKCNAIGDNVSPIKFFLKSFAKTDRGLTIIEEFVKRGFHQLLSPNSFSVLAEMCRYYDPFTKRVAISSIEKLKSMTHISNDTAYKVLDELAHAKILKADREPIMTPTIEAKRGFHTKKIVFSFYHEAKWADTEFMELSSKKEIRRWRESARGKFERKKVEKRGRFV